VLFDLVEGEGDGLETDVEVEAEILEKVFDPDFEVVGLLRLEAGDGKVGQFGPFGDSNIGIALPGGQCQGAACRRYSQSLVVFW